MVWSFHVLLLTKVLAIILLLGGEHISIFSFSYALQRKEKEKEREKLGVWGVFVVVSIILFVNA